MFLTGFILALASVIVLVATVPIVARCSMHGDDAEILEWRATPSKSALLHHAR
jgi:hypothetical protein